MRFALFAIATLLASPAGAQVYKCTENGLTVFRDRPCHADAQPLDVRPAAGAYDRAAGLEAELRTARAQAAIAEAEAERARIAAEESRRQALAPKVLTPCEQMQSDYNEALRMSREYQHPLNVQGELAKANRARERSFWECSPGQRISTLPTATPRPASN